MTLQERCKKMTNELGIPTTKFCEHIGLGRTTFYDWTSGRASYKLSDERLKAIEDFLTKYGF